MTKDEIVEFAKTVYTLAVNDAVARREHKRGAGFDVDPVRGAWTDGMRPMEKVWIRYATLTLRHLGVQVPK
jgi:hypothetical protein